MANSMENICCGSFTFYNGFDSANLARVEQVTGENENETKSCPVGNVDDVDYEFNLWTKHDCHGTQFQNNNRTWFYFGIKSSVPGALIKLNIVNMNKQVKMFSQGMCPVFKTVPGHMYWERIRDKPTFTLDQKGNDFTLSFTYRTPENVKTMTYFAFTYPFSYSDLQNYLRRIDTRMMRRSTTRMDDIYYHRECAIRSLEGRRLDVITISSFHNISMEREDRLTNMFPEETEERPFKFWNKKVIFISARVHPGETPSSFVLNGLMNFLLNRDDQIAITLRRSYVFKLIPMLNPDGVARGHYRMDTRGVNLNRVYLNPSEKDHPTIYAARNLIRYYHYSYKLPENCHEKQPIANVEDGTGHTNDFSENGPDLNNTTKNDTATKLLRQVTLMTLNENGKGEPFERDNLFDAKIPRGQRECFAKDIDETEDYSAETHGDEEQKESGKTLKKPENSGLYLYIDLHGHASKKGVFMYGNHFEDPEDIITCMLLPKLMSINDPNFHFTSCNFTERNMYLIDKRDGMSREGSGRVAVYKMTGLVRSYTLECNYNSGRLVNVVPSRVRDTVSRAVTHVYVPPKYNPSLFEAVGAAIGPSILDLTNTNPNSRLPNSQYRTLRGVRSFLRLTYVNGLAAGKPATPQKDAGPTALSSRRGRFRRGACARRRKSLRPEVPARASPGPRIAEKKKKRKKSDDEQRRVVVIAASQSERRVLAASQSERRVAAVGTNRSAPNAATAHEIGRTAPKRRKIAANDDGQQFHATTTTAALTTTRIATTLRKPVTNLARRPRKFLPFSGPKG